jgi:hypothetical protein
MAAHYAQRFSFAAGCVAQAVLVFPTQAPGQHSRVREGTIVPTGRRRPQWRQVSGLRGGVCAGISLARPASASPTRPRSRAHTAVGNPRSHGGR